jgi:hypothetical protein
MISQPGIFHGIFCSLILSLTIPAAGVDKLNESKSFVKQRLTDRYYSEGATFGDLNRDGNGDVISGPYWYEGPAFKSKHEIYPPKDYPNDKGYVDNNFFSFVYDFDRDGWDDVFVIGFPGTPSYWFRNPKADTGHWKRFEAFPNVDNESPGFRDINGDGRPDLYCMFQGRLGYAVFNPDHPTHLWKFHFVSKKHSWSRFAHGLGYGDIDGDGRIDLLTASGWWRQPEDLKGDPIWEENLFPFSKRGGGAQMYAYDVDGDGDSDVITSLSAHQYGLSWYENIKEGNHITFREHRIMDQKPEDNSHGLVFSQLHAVDLVDVDGDGLKDILTGKCYWAHNGRDPGARDPAVLYYFQLNRENGIIRFIPQQIDDDSGCGRQITAGDINGDGRTDLVVGNKKGAFVFLQSGE